MAHGRHLPTPVRADFRSVASAGASSLRVEPSRSAFEGRAMSFAIYLVGLAVLMGGVAWGLIAAGMTSTHVAITCLVVGGIGIMMAVSRTRAKDPPV